MKLIGEGNEEYRGPEVRGRKYRWREYGRWLITGLEGWKERRKKKKKNAGEGKKKGWDDSPPLVCVG